MKKISIYATLLFLICSLCLPVLAAQSVSITVEASATQLHRGDELTVSFRTNTQLENCVSGVYGFVFDRDVFTFIEGSCSVDATLSGTDEQSGLVTGFFQLFKQLDGISETTLPAGTLYIIRLKVKEDAPFGATVITGEECSFTTSTGPASVEPGTQTVTIQCQHSYGEWTLLNSTTEHRICSVCQNEQTRTPEQAPTTAPTDPVQPTQPSKPETPTHPSEPESATQPSPEATPSAPTHPNAPTIPVTAGEMNQQHPSVPEPTLSQAGTEPEVTLPENNDLHPGIWIIALLSGCGVLVAICLIFRRKRLSKTGE